MNLKPSGRKHCKWRDFCAVSFSLHHTLFTIRRKNMAREKSGGDDDQTVESRELQEIKELGAAYAKSDKGSIQCLTIVGQVEGHQILPEDNKTTKYEHVMPLLAAVEESDEIEGLLVMLNTMGGDVEAGLGIAELIASMKTPWWRALNRRTSCGGGSAFIHRTFRRHDHTPGALKRRCNRRTPDV